MTVPRPSGPWTTSPAECWLQGVTFRIYAEGITQGYVGGDTGLYLIRHNPFAMLSDVAE